MIPYFSLTEIDLGFGKIQIWGLTLVMAILAGLFLVTRLAKKKNISSNVIVDLTLIVIAAGLIGARLYYVLNEWSYYWTNPGDILKIWQGGLGFFGGLVFGVFFGWLYLRKKKISFFLISDMMVLALAIGEAIGRIGCFLIHDHIGKITNLPWGVEYFGEVRHETSLYSFLAALVIFFTLLMIKKSRLDQFRGLLTSTYMVLYGLFSFFIYQLRADDLVGSDPHWGWLRPSQYFSLILIIFGLILYFKALKQKSQ